jgi:hypothetical protein
MACSVGVAMTTSPIQLGRNIAIFIVVTECTGAVCFTATSKDASSFDLGFRAVGGYLLSAGSKRSFVFLSFQYDHHARTANNFSRFH